MFFSPPCRPGDFPAAPIIIHTLSAALLSESLHTQQGPQGGPPPPPESLRRFLSANSNFAFHFFSLLCLTLGTSCSIPAACWLSARPWKKHRKTGRSWTFSHILTTGLVVSGMLDQLNYGSTQRDCMLRVLSAGPHPTPNLQVVLTNYRSTLRDSIASKQAKHFSPLTASSAN